MRVGVLQSSLFVPFGLLTIACPSKSEPPSHRDATTNVATTQPSSRPSTALSVPEMATASVSAALVRPHVEILASDRLEGRGAATRGIGLAAAYIERVLRELRLQPAFDGSHRQGFELEVGVMLGPKSRLELGKARFRMGKDFVPLAFSGTGTTSGPLAFVGYGIRAPELSYDDFERVDAKGRVLVFFDGEPGELSEDSPFDGKRSTRHASLRGKILRAREAGAKAAIVVREKLPRAGKSSPESDAGLITLAVTPKVAQKLLGFDVIAAKRDIDRDFKPRAHAFADRVVSIQADVRRERLQNQNLAGLLVPPGATSDEVVVIGAHYDHLGFGGASSLSGHDKPEVHNGADDNASGCAAVLEAARSLAADPTGLERKILFVLFAGEESGLLGSQHFVANSPVPLEKIVMMVNLDMVGHLRKRTFDIMGADSAEGLRHVISELSARRGLTPRFGGGAVGPSDHTAFYTKGVPVAFLFTGAHEHYHRPSDDVETIDYRGLAEMASLTADLTRALATMNERPRYVRVEEPKSASAGRGYGPSFGSIPEFGDHTDGVHLSGVRPGSPAEKAGVRGGDVIVRFDGLGITNLTDFTEVLRSKAPGDEVVVAVRRGEETLEFKAKLERRDP